MVTELPEKVQAVLGVSLSGFKGFRVQALVLGVHDFGFRVWGAWGCWGSVFVNSPKAANAKESVSFVFCPC